LHEVSLAGAILAIPFGLWLNGWQDTLIGFVVGLGVMLGLYYFGILFNRWMSKRRGQEMDEVALGFGDVILSAVLGIMLGWPRIIVCLFTAIVLGGLISGLYILVMVLRKRYQAFTAIPYAPFLVIAAVILIYMA
jgi:leader peptidase (prepilin peptidase)/N-methyltransferase